MKTFCGEWNFYEKYNEEVKKGEFAFWIKELNFIPTNYFVSMYERSGRKMRNY